MRKWVFVCLLLTISTTTFAKDSSPVLRAGNAARYAQRDATVLSMMGWGLGLAVGIGAFFALIDDGSASSDSGSTSGGGSSGGGSSHTHSHS